LHVRLRVDTNPAAAPLPIRAGGIAHIGRALTVPADFVQPAGVAAASAVVPVRVEIDALVDRSHLAARLSPVTCRVAAKSFAGARIAYLADRALITALTAVVRVVTGIRAFAVAAALVRGTYHTGITTGGDTFTAHAAFALGALPAAEAAVPVIVLQVDAQAVTAFQGHSAVDGTASRSFRASESQEQRNKESGNYRFTSFFH